MSRASNLAGFTTSISPPTNLSVGIITAISFSGSGSGLTGVGLGTTGSINTSGIITASSFSGNGSGLTGVAATTLTIGAGTTALPSISPTGDSNTGIFFPSADTIAFSEGGTEAMRVDSSGRLLIGISTSGNANGGPLQLSGGITFPATAVAATDVNTLDDYEEGTWTPVVTPDAGGTFTTITTTGTYIKIGKKVTLLLYVDVVSVGTALGAWAITGIPFGPSGTHTYIYGTGANLNTGVLVVYQIFTPGPNISIRPGTGSTLCATGTRVGAEITFIG